MRIAVLVLALAMLAMAQPAAPAASGAPCEDVVFVLGQGPSCPAPGGWLVRLDDGTVGFTHGPDHLPDLPLSASPPAPVDVACVTEEQPHLLALYVYPSDGRDLAAAQEGLIVASLLQANAVVHATGAKFGVPMRWPMLCQESGLPRVDVVQVPTPTAFASFHTIVQDLRNLGYGKALEKLVIFYDGPTGCGCAGQGYIPGGDSPDPENPNNYGHLGFAITYLGNSPGPVWALARTALHEVTHTMGGVQLSAPHTSGAYHCTDGWDIMCYNDGGSRSWYYHTRACLGAATLTLAEAYDCNNDDYFHPAPAAGSYLDKHWNVGAAYNRFLHRD